MNDKLRELRRALIRIAAVPDEQFGQVAELVNREVGRERRLASFLADDSDACSPPASATHILSPTTRARGGVPTSAAWIIETSFPPSPMQQTRFLVWARMRRATSAFCVGEQRQATTEIGRAHV